LDLLKLDRITPLEFITTWPNGPAILGTPCVHTKRFRLSFPITKGSEGKSMRAVEFATPQKRCWRNIAIALIDP